MSSSSMGLSDAVLTYLRRVGVREDDDLKALREATVSMPMAMMQISPEQGQFMSLLVKILGPKRCLEVGVFTGYSAMTVAKATWGLTGAWSAWMSARSSPASPVSTGTRPVWPTRSICVLPRRWKVSPHLVYVCARSVSNDLPKLSTSTDLSPELGPSGTRIFLVFKCCRRRRGASARRKRRRVGINDFDRCAVS